MPRVLPEYKEEARKRILRGAYRVFSEKGYHKTTMADIARELGVSKGALYLYFKSKEALYQAGSEEDQIALKDMLRSVLKDSNVMEHPEKILDELLLRHVSAYHDEEEGKLGVLDLEMICEASRNSDLRALLSKHFEGLQKIIEDFLREQKEKGLVRSDADVHSLSLAYFALFHGLLDLLVLGTSEEEEKKAWAEFTRMQMPSARTHR